MDSKILISLGRVVLIVLVLNILRGGSIRFLGQLALNMVGIGLFSLLVYLVLNGLGPNLQGFFAGLDAYFKGQTGLNSGIKLGLALLLILAMFLLFNLVSRGLGTIHKRVLKPLSQSISNNRLGIFLREVFLNIFTTSIIYIAYAELMSPDHVMSQRRFGQWLFTDDSSQNFKLNIMAILIASFLALALSFILARLLAYIKKEYD